MPKYERGKEQEEGVEELKLYAVWSTYCPPTLINTATPSLCLRLRVGNQLFRAKGHGAERTAPLPQVSHQRTAGHTETLRNRSELLVRNDYKWCPCSVKPLTAHFI